MVQECIDWSTHDDEVLHADSFDLDVQDRGHSVVVRNPDAVAGIIEGLGLPEWTTSATLTAPLMFGDYGVASGGSSEYTEVIIFDRTVAPT